MKKGTIVRFTEERFNPGVFKYSGESSTEEWGKSDACTTVRSGTADLVYVCQVIAVVKRDASVTE